MLAQYSSDDMRFLADVLIEMHNVIRSEHGSALLIVLPSKLLKKRPDSASLLGTLWHEVDNLLELKEHNQGYLLSHIYGEGKDHLQEFGLLELHSVQIGFSMLNGAAINAPVMVPGLERIHR